MQRILSFSLIYKILVFLDLKKKRIAIKIRVPEKKSTQTKTYRRSEAIDDVDST